MATSLFKAQIPFRIKGQFTCTHHKGGQLDLYCEECQIPVCIKCVSTVHKSHPLCDLSEIIHQTKQDVQSFIDKTEKVDLVQIDQYITSTDKHLKDNTSNFDKLSHHLKTQTNKLKEDLDQLTAQTLSLYQQMEEDNTKLLQTYKQDLEVYDAKLKKQVQECKIALQRGSDIQIYDTGCEIQSALTLPAEPTLCTASFTPNQNPEVHLKQALGEVNTSCHCQGQASPGHDMSVGSSTGQGSTSTQQNSTGRKKVKSPVYRLLPQTKVLGNWTSPCYITSVCPTIDGQVWTSACDDITLNLLDRKGKVIQKIKHNTGITEISLSPTTNTLWVCDLDNNITELVSGRLVHRFGTREEPRCICITASNHVIVGMNKKISKFTTEGTLLHTTSAAGTGKPFVCTPYRISECPVTHNVAVADLGNTLHGGEGKPRVVVIDTDFKKLFEYDGKVPHTYQPTSQSGSKRFTPWGVVYDSVGNLVIGDCSNNRIILINGCGEFLRIIHTYDYFALAIGVDREDVLWAVLGYHDIKLLQYQSAQDQQQCIIS
ncbi:tripartite motif-containing protein 2-like [Mizuhopecten yessoensis]|uniref:tripartite motif-containing protein 2-like n=1 Tax=Mizuhopecten yessoensis TaxID=6573 RepID=UPI000B459502|nr:tripartite motif-containing protein 2-like [Mizuhopecten yessoensis]